MPAGNIRFDAAEVSDVKDAAEQTAAEGASLAHAAGFNARSAALEAAPTWKGIVKTAAEHDSSLIVLGSHGRTGLAGGPPGMSPVLFAVRAPPLIADGCA